ncbi:MAG: hypothetical protein ACREQO_25185 [Candidatus Binatia bacterium]
MPLKAPLYIFVLLGSFVFAPALWGQELNVYFKTSPRIELLRPFADPAEMSLLVTGDGGRPLENATVNIRLEAPEPGRFFSTDMPIVEGTALHEMTLKLRQGRVNWKYLFPIRGEYKLLVDVLTADGRKAAKTFVFEIREKETKWLTLAAFSGALFVFGFGAGRIFTRTTARAALVMLAVWFGGSARAATAPSPAARLAGKLAVEPATVGKLSRIAWRLENDGQLDQRLVVLTLTVTHLEKSKIVFAVEKLPIPGEFVTKFQFPDGAEYRVTALTNVAGLEPVRNEQVISVTGIEPPARAATPALLYFIALIAAGLGAGRWSKIRRSF